MITFYKPNKNKTGSLINFSLAAGQSANKEFKEGCVYCNIIKQTAWNEGSHTGSFKGGDTLNVKLNMIELGKMLSTMETKLPFSTYHKGYNQNVQINFSVWRDKETKEERGYGLILTVIKDGEKKRFAIGFNFGEDVVLRRFLKLAIEHIMLANYAEEKRLKKTFTKKTQPAASNEPENEQEQSSELIDDINVFGEE